MIALVYLASALSAAEGFDKVQGFLSSLPSRGKVVQVKEVPTN